MPDLITVAATALIVTVAAALQSAVGFGMGLVTVPLLLWTGRTLPEAVAVLFGASVVQTAYGTWMSRRDIPWRTTIGLVSVQWLCLPLGLWGMAALTSAGPERVKQFVGVAVAAMLVLRAVLRPTPREQVHAGWGVLASSLSGFLAGLVGMGGPPIVLFALAHDWQKDRFRGFLWATFLMVLPAAAALLAWRFGPSVLLWALLGVAMAPVLWIGSRMGLSLSTHWDAPRLRRAATALLVVVVLWSVAGPYLIG
jgi:uncharacterized membrane protein YfcA